MRGMEDWEIIEKTAEIIEKRGHCSGFLVNGLGNVCVDGALILALGYEVEDLENERYDILKDYDTPERIVTALDLKCISGEVDASTDLFFWNDLGYNVLNLSLDDDKQRVLDGLRKAAKIVRAEDGL